MFKNRQEAGQLLGKRLEQTLKLEDELKPDQVIVLGLPRGGVIVAVEVAKILDTRIGILVSKKIGAPHQPEFALGAVSAAGVVVLNEEVGQGLTGIKTYLVEQSKKLMLFTQNLQDEWTEKANLPQLSELKDKVAVLVDDGVATGMTTWAAIRAAKTIGAKKVILATPVIAQATKRWLAAECDAVVSVLAPGDLQSVGEFFSDFHQVDESEMLNSLKSIRFANNSI